MYGTYFRPSLSLSICCLAKQPIQHLPRFGFAIQQDKQMLLPGYNCLLTLHE